MEAAEPPRPLVGTAQLECQLQTDNTYRVATASLLRVVSSGRSFPHQVVPLLLDVFVPSGGIEPRGWVRLGEGRVSARPEGR